MGYVTRFTLKVLDPKMEPADARFQGLIANAKVAGTLDEDTSKYKEEYLARVQEAGKLLNEQVVLNVLEAIEYEDPHKWYDHEKDMLAFSKLLPDFIFELHGEGEESSDIWVKWFHRGKMQGGRAKVVLPEFDPKGWK